jgi:hypothetical protein
LIHSHQLWAEVLKQSEYRDEFTSLWRRMKLDLCLSPSFGLPAPHEDHIGRLMGRPRRRNSRQNITKLLTF